MENIINLTPHTINVRILVTYDTTDIEKKDPINNWVTIPASGNIARLSQKTIEVGSLNGMKITQEVFGETQGLPAQEDGTFYIVSSLVAAQNKDRNDLLVPGRALRNETGQIIGTESLAFMSEVIPAAIDV